MHSYHSRPGPWRPGCTQWDSSCSRHSFEKQRWWRTFRHHNFDKRRSRPSQSQCCTFLPNSSCSRTKHPAPPNCCTFPPDSFCSRPRRPGQPDRCTFPLRTLSTKLHPARTTSGRRHNSYTMLIRCFETFDPRTSLHHSSCSCTLVLRSELGTVLRCTQRKLTGLLELLFPSDMLDSYPMLEFHPLDIRHKFERRWSCSQCQ